jgi:hypothetical protein
LRHLQAAPAAGALRVLQSGGDPALAPLPAAAQRGDATGAAVRLGRGAVGAGAPADQHDCVYALDDVKKAADAVGGSG